MANVNSDQITSILAGEAIGSNMSHGRERVAYFQVAALPTTGIGDTVTLCKIPKGARVIDGAFVLSLAQGAVATLAFGTASSPTKYKFGAVVNAANSLFDLAFTSATMGQETTTEETIIATVGAAALAGGSMRGYLRYVVD